MLSRSSAAPSALLLLLLVTLSSIGSAHTVISYPGSRGNNLRPGNATFPYDLQWQYPCGGMDITNNRTKWPLQGGAIAIQPGWFVGHATAFFYINMGYQTEGPGTNPVNMSHPMVPVFQLVGPSKEAYPGTFCLPQVPLPANAPNFKVGDNATIQVIETAVHGAALYNCIDITFAEPEDVVQVNETNCFNSSEFGFNTVYGTNASSGAVPSLPLPASWTGIAPLMSVAIIAALTSWL